ncbi:MAG TPA: hypothetical protein VK943_19385 [Arenibaculum sp.]|jgi:hypothetical protein|nr:hypothetical protein [Arenibaculum sp.]
MRSPSPSCLSGIVLACAALLLPGCASFRSDSGTGTARDPGAVRLEPGPAASTQPPVGREHATFGFMAAEGAPERVAQSLARAIESAAAAEGLAAAPAASASYVVRAYLSAIPSGEEAIAVYVFDIFDRNATRLFRISGTVAIEGGRDPWRGMNAAAADQVAAAAARAIAAWLTGAISTG